MKNGSFTEHFVRTDSTDGVAGVLLIQNRKGDIIDFNDKSSQLRIRDESEARELIKLIEEGILHLNGKSK